MKKTLSATGTLWDKVWKQNKTEFKYNCNDVYGIFTDTVSFFFSDIVWKRCFLNTETKNLSKDSWISQNFNVEHSFCLKSPLECKDLIINYLINYLIVK